MALEDRSFLGTGLAFSSTKLGMTRASKVTRDRKETVMNHQTKSKEEPAMSRKMITSAVVFLLALVAGCDASHNETGEKEVQPIKGFPEASLTIFPVTYAITGPVDKSPEYRAFADALMRGWLEVGPENADTLGLLLEEKGYDKFEVTDTAFRFPEGKAARKERAAAFGTFVGELGLKTDYALCTKFVCHIEDSFQEVYTVIVDAKGGIVWEDSQGPDDPGFAVGDELTGCQLVCRRLTPVMGLDKLPKKELAEDKKQVLRKMRWEELPSQSEFAAIEKRLETMKKSGTSARVMIYPTRMGGDHTDPDRATHLAELFNEAGLCQATVAKTGPVLEGGGWPDESTVLWLFARAAREHARQHPADSDYVLFADYWLNPRGEVWAVHFVVLDRAGDWVIVALQNSHQDVFQQISPKTLEDCDQIVLECLKGLTLGDDTQE